MTTAESRPRTIPEELALIARRPIIRKVGTKREVLAPGVAFFARRNDCRRLVDSGDAALAAPEAAAPWMTRA